MEDLGYWLERLKKVDTLLSEPSLSLIALGQAYLDGPGGRMPAWISERSTPDPAAKRSLLVHSVACSTLQRLWRTHRRYPWLTRDARDALKTLQPLIADRAEEIAETANPLRTLSDPVFGRMNPFVAAEVFWNLLQAGQNRVVGGTGFLSIFSMLWSLFATHPPDRGYALGDTRTLAASVTAKCLRPLLQLQAMFRARGRLYRAIRKVILELDGLAERPTPNRWWKFACAADRLAGYLLELSRFAINREGFERAAKEISAIAQQMAPNQPKHSPKVPLDRIRAIVIRALADLRRCNQNTLGDAQAALTTVRERLLPELKLPPSTTRSPFLTQLRPRLPDETDDSYWKRIHNAAQQALGKCDNALKTLVGAVVSLEAVAPPKTPEELAQQQEMRSLLSAIAPGYTPEEVPPDTDRATWALLRLAIANETVATDIENSIAPSTHWCRFVVRQEVAYASAGNDTDFDPAELLSAVAIAERSGYISELEVEDALEKALRGLRPDGSWSAGQPIYLTKRVLGVWPSSADIAWLLAGAVSGTPKIRRGDAALMSFADWLERTRTHFDRHLHDTWTEDDEKTHMAGWSAETREARTIDLWVTSIALNALIEIRELIEHRLWELCEQRFFVIRPRDLKDFDTIDPVDAGALHEHRLHHRLRRSARQSSGPDYRDAEYSFVFHGPPGSSKTAMAEGLGREMWRESSPNPRVIRITPADFTRQGEAGLDAEARFIFELLSHLRGVTIIFDEIDDLLRRRELKGNPAFLKMVVPAMLNRLQDLRDAAPRQELCFVVAMNYVDNVEPALIRPGRIDAALPVVYPDPWSRDNTLDRVIEARGAVELFDDLLRAQIVTRTDGWAWPIYNRLCENVVAAFLGGKLAPEEKRARTDQLIRELATQRQDVESHYAEKLRWSPVSPELVNEVAHFAMAYDRTPAGCSQRVPAILRREGGPSIAALQQAIGRRGRSSSRRGRSPVETVQEKLTTEWRREKRQTYPRAALMRTRDMGATRFADAEATVFRVWAPAASEVTLVRGTGKIPLTREEGSVWAGEVTGVAVEERYRYEFGDETVALTDPYAREVDPDAQWSRVVDPIAAPPGFDRDWQKLVLYQIHPASFAGAVQNAYDVICSRLDQLEHLGVTGIDLVGAGEPVHTPVRHDWRAIHQIEERYGGTSALRTLIKTAHAKHLAVFIGATTRELLGRSVADLGAYGEYFAGENDLGPRPDFRKPQVRALAVENARRWIHELGVDGIRWAGTNFVTTAIDPATQRAYEVPEGWATLREVTKKIRELGRGLLIAGDLEGMSRLVSDAPDCAGFHVQWYPAFERAVRQALAPAYAALPPANVDLEPLKTAIMRRREPDEGDVYWRINYSETFDTIRQKGRLSDALHGQGALPAEARQRAFLATTLTLLTPGIPLIFQGQELWSEPGLDAVDPLPWDAQSGITRRLEQLIALRRNVAGTTAGLLGHRCYVQEPQKRILVIERWDQDQSRNDIGHVVAVLNFTSHDAQPAVRFPFAGDWVVRYNATADVYDTSFGQLPSGPVVTPAPDTRVAKVPVGGFSAVILSQDVNI